MRVLVVSKFWYRRGGLERVMFDECKWLADSGHELAHFSTQHPQNDPSPWDGYFAPHLELGQGRRLTPSQTVTAALRMFHNEEAARRFRTLLNDFRPNVVHAHGVHHQLSPSILTTARRAGVPVVQTLHDFHHICPGGVLLRSGREVCDSPLCSRFNYLPAVRHRCVHGSLAASGLSACETAFQNTRGVYQRCVDRFISPSRFLADRMAASGWDRVPIDVVPNATSLPDRGEGGSSFLYLGRLSAEKGVTVAIDAARRAGVRLLVAGDGPLANMLRAEGGAEFLGQLSPEKVAQRLNQARAVVVPSLCLESFGMSALDAMAAGLPVVASRIGAIPELVRDGVDGILVSPGDPSVLADAMAHLDGHPEYARHLGTSGRTAVGSRFSPEQHLAKLLECYRLAGAEPSAGEG